MRDLAYLQFLRSYGRCVACVCNFRYSPMGCDPAHGPANGMGSKGPDDGAIPLCRSHHAEQHAMAKWPKFEANYGFSRAKEAKIWYSAYLESKGKA